MRRRIRSDSEVKHKQLKPPLAAQSRSVNLHKGPTSYDMHLFLTDESAENQGSEISVPAHLNSMHPNKAANSPDIVSPTRVVKDCLPIEENPASCEITSFQNVSPGSPGSLSTSGRPTSMSSIASSRTSRGSDYFSSSSSADTHHEIKTHRSGAEFELISELNDNAVADRPVLNKVVESVREEEEEEGFVDSENFSSANEKHFNNSSNIEEKVINPPKLSKRIGVSVKDINKKLSEVDHLSPIATMAMVANPQLTYVDRIILELLETERMYVRALEDILAGYIIPIRNASLPVSLSDVEKLFLNIKDIYAFNRKFLSFLENCESDPVLIAEHFVSKDVSFNVYTEYCTNYPIAIGVLTRWMKIPVLADFFKSQQEMLRHNLPLGSYLLKPVQRILKYHLILQELVKNCDEDIENYWIIEQALHTMTHIAQHINEMKRKHEDAVHVQEIQSLLTNWQGDDLTTYGDIVMEGDLKLQGAKNERMVFLFDKMILITKRREDGFLVCKITIMCSDLILLESIKENPLSFLISPFDSPSFHNHSSRATKQYTLTAKFPDEKKLWTQNIKRLIIKNHHAAIPLHAQQSIMNMDAVGLDDGIEHHQRKPRYSNTSIDDFKRPPLKRFGTTLSASSLGLSGKGPIRRRSDSGSRKSLQMRSFRKKHDTELSDEVSSDSVPNTPNAINPGKGRFSFPRISHPVSSKLCQEMEKKKGCEQDKLGVENSEVTEKDTVVVEEGDEIHDAFYEEEKENSKKSKKARAKKNENYKKSVIYRRHKRRISEPITDQEIQKNGQCSIDEKVEKNKLDMSLEDFETAEDFLSSNIDNTRESVSWDIQIVEAAFERFKRDQAKAAELRADSIDPCFLIPMPNRKRYISFSDSSDDEVPPLQHHEEKTEFQKQPGSAPNVGGVPDMFAEEVQAGEELSADNNVLQTMNGDLTQNDDDKSSLHVTPVEDNNTEVDHAVSSTNENNHKSDDSAFIDPPKPTSTKSVTPKIKQSLSTLSSLNERQKYFERLKEIRDRRHSQRNLGPDAKTIQSGLVKEMIEHHRENMTSQVNHSGFSPSMQKHNPFDRALAFTGTAHVSTLQNELSQKEDPQQGQPKRRENDKVNETPTTVKSLKNDRYENTPKYPTKESTNTSAYLTPQLRKTTHRIDDLETTDNRQTNNTPADLLLNSTRYNGSSIDCEKQHDAQNPAKLKFKNFLQPKMLLWSEYSKEIGSRNRRGRNLKLEGCPTPCTVRNLIDRQNSNARQSDCSHKSEHLLKERGTNCQNTKTNEMTPQSDRAWKGLKTEENKIVHSSSSSDSLLYNRQRRDNSPNSSAKLSDPKVLPNKKASASISLRSNPTSPTVSTKTKIRQIRLASSSEKDFDQKSEINKSPSSTTELKQGKGDLHKTTDDSKASSVMKLAQKFDSASIITSPIISRPYGRSRSVGARKQLSEFRFSARNESTAKNKDNEDGMTTCARGSFQRRNSASDRLHREKSQSPPRKASYTASNKTRLHRRTSERVILNSELTSHKGQKGISNINRASKEQNLQLKKYQKEPSKSDKSWQDDVKLNKFEKRKLALAKPQEENSEEARLLEENQEQIIPSKLQHHTVCDNNFVLPLSMVNAFCATTKSESDAVESDMMSHSSELEKLSRCSSPETSLTKPNHIPPSDFVALFAK